MEKERSLKPLNLFISYSHKDEEYVNELKKHLITLKRNRVIDVWHDRELVAGDNLDEEVLGHLLQSDLIVFIVSVDFLDSWYCYEVELTKTLSRVDFNDIRIVPVIARKCKWKDTELSKYLAVPTDGADIFSWHDKNAAWVNVVEAIEKCAEKLASARASQSVSIKSKPSNAVLREEFLDFLNDTEIQFNHRYKDKILLGDIFVSPDVKNIKREFDEMSVSTPAINLVNESQVTEKVLVLGSEQSGKTALAKMFFNKYCSNGFVPLYCNGKQINNVDIEKLIVRLLEKQYIGLGYEDYADSKARRVLVIDDYDKLKINIRFQEVLLDALSDHFDKVVVFSGTSIRYNESKYVELSDFEQYEIMPFGNLRRGELIERWVSIGRTETIEISELHNDTDNITTHVDSIIRKNILPPKPIYVLTIIQLLDTSNPVDFSLTSYGHCYQSLIQNNLERVNIKPREFDLYLNYLTELAYYIYKSDAEVVEKDLLSNFQASYSEKYLVQSHDDIMQSLLAAGIVGERNDYVGFRYRYIFYFYVAKYIADHIECAECKKAVTYLCENLNTEKNANILIFLTHHSKDSSIIDEILLHSSVIFDGVKEASLDKSDTKYLIDYIAAIPELVIEQRDIEKERKSRLEKRDRLERELNEEIENERDDDIHDDGEERTLSEINRSARVVEIIGQILRNRYGSLQKHLLKELTLSAYSSGLRFLNYFLTETREEQDYILEYIQLVFRENTSLSDDEIIKEARNIFLLFCYGTSYAVVKKIAASIGSEKLLPVFKEINAENHDSPAMRLIYIAIQMEFTKAIPKKDLLQLFSELEGNPIARRLLQEIVIQHLYLNHVEYQDRQWISDKLKLPIQSQRILQAKIEYKT